MPSVSPAQERLMLAVDHGWKPTGSAKGLTKKVAHEFVQADKRVGRIGAGKMRAKPNDGDHEYR